MTVLHILEASQFSDKEFLESIFQLASEIEANKEKFSRSLKGKFLINLFYEPSTRTRFSFDIAMQCLGGKVVGTEAASHFSSAAKGEIIEDTVRVIEEYDINAIVIRHPEKGSVKRASLVSKVPIINAGDGDGEHPTQALLDLYTIKKEFGYIDKLKIAMVGDLKYGRTVHSLTNLLAMHSKNSKLYFISPEQIKMPEDIIKSLKDKQIDFGELASFDSILEDVDVFYITRIQKERFVNEQEYNEVKDLFVIDKAVLDKMKENAVIMHPLPRVKEIAREVDDDKRAAYFRQAGNGLYIRMALLRILLDGAIKKNFYKYFNI